MLVPQRHYSPVEPDYDYGTILPGKVHNLFSFVGYWGSKPVTKQVPHMFVGSLLTHASVISLVSTHIGLGGRNGGFRTYYPFRGRGAPSFAIGNRGRFCRYFKYNTRNGTVSFLVGCSGLRFIRAIRRLTTVRGLRIPFRTNDNPDRVRHRRERALCRLVSNLGAFCRRSLRRPITASTHRCLRGHKLDRRIVTHFTVNFTPPN